MKRKQGRAVVFLVIVGAILTIMVVSALYIDRLNRSVIKNTMQLVGELSEHDQNQITAHIEQSWDSLDYLRGKLIGYNCNTIPEIERYMNVECANSEFTQLYLVASDGRIYTDKYVVYDPTSDNMSSRIDLRPYFEGDKDRIVVRFDDKVSTAGIGKEYILYGIRLKDFWVEDRQMVALAGVCDINSIQDELVISSFVKDGENRGFSAVIDMDGNYVVNVDRTIYYNQTDNFFDWVDSSQESELDRETVHEKISRGESFSFTRITEDGDKRVVYLMPFAEQEIEWYFLMSVKYTVFTEQSHEFLMMSLLMMAIILVVVVGLLYVAMLSRQRSLEVNAEAKARSEFMANMSHEIRTPLNGVIGLIQLMERDFDRDGSREVMRERLAKARVATGYLLSLVNDILDVSKLQAGKMELEHEVISPEHIVDATCAMQKNNIEGRGIRFVIEKDISVPWMMGDEIRIEQVLMNILGNAAKFTPAGGTITFSVSQSREHDEFVATTFVCRDTGCGMSEEFLEHIWESFSQERNKISGSVKGTGLGLAISKLLVDAMGGTITAESKLGEGSTFTVMLISEIAQAPVQADAASAGGSLAEVRERPVRILIAEDNELNAEILLDILENEGFAVALATDGRDAVDQFAASKNQYFDVILMDMQMPVMDGCEAAAKIRSLNRQDAKQVTIFACTANTFQEDRNRALESGMNDFLTKPIDVDILLKKISELKL